MVQTGGAFVFDEREERRKAGDQFGQIERSGKRDRELAGSAFDALIETFLESGNVDVETENLGGERMFDGKVLGAPDALLPGSGGHGGIMGLRSAAGQLLEVLQHRVTEDTTRGKNEGFFCVSVTLW